jgi:hypothetical protein
MTSNSYHHSWLGSGITLTEEISVADGATLRPRTIESDIERLRCRASSQLEYGLLCSIAPNVTFELVTSAGTAREAALKNWNNQYALIFLSIVARSFIHCSIQVSGSYRDDPDQPLIVSHGHGITLLKAAPTIVSSDDLADWKALLPNFTRLLEINRFQYAASIAGTVYVHPNPSVQVASIFSAIEALIDVEQELRFRISMTVAKLLSDDPIERPRLFRKLKKLYDVRSKCVHGGGTTREKIIECRDESLEILRQLIIFLVAKGELPDKQSLEDFLVS